MSVMQKDLILRLIEQIAAMLARLSGLVAAQKYPEALQLIDEAERTLLGDQLASLCRLDSTSAALVLHNPDRVRTWAFLLAERANVLSLMGQTADAKLQAQRAQSLYTAAERRGAVLTEDDRAARSRIESL